MQMISQRAGHEFYRRFGERARDVCIIPTVIDRDLAHGKTGGKGFRLFIQGGLETKSPADQFGSADPVVTDLIVSVCQSAEIKISPAPKAIGFGLDRFVNQ